MKENIKETIAKTIAIIIFFVIFIGLLSLVGNPAKEETMIIFIIALVSSFFIYLKLGGRKLK